MGFFARRLESTASALSTARSWPQRTDLPYRAGTSIYVTEAHFGLKQRNGEALELKVREKKQKVDWSFGQSHLCPTVWSTCVVRKYM